MTPIAKLIEMRDAARPEPGKVRALARLVDAVEHGLKNHDCARHGWELDAGCLDRARAAWLAKRRKP